MNILVKGAVRMWKYSDELYYMNVVKEKKINDVP